MNSFSAYPKMRLEIIVLLMIFMFPFSLGSTKCKRIGTLGTVTILTCADSEYCCDQDKWSAYCCNFIFYRLDLIVGIIISFVIAGFFIGCLCCLFCPFCVVYRRRRGQAHYSSLVQSQSTNPAQPVCPSQPTCPPQPVYPTQPTYPAGAYQAPYPVQAPVGVSQPYAPPYAEAAAHGNPPSYNEAVSNEMYPSSPPYNPNF